MSRLVLPMLIIDTLILMGPQLDVPVHTPKISDLLEPLQLGEFSSLN